jgi:hypothetical protein
VLLRTVPKVFKSGITSNLLYLMFFFMAEPTLIEIFGVGATQNANEITILKNSLTGLTPSANNTPESLLAAIILKAQTKLTQESQDANPEQNITIENGISSIVTRNNQNYREYQLNINFQKIDTQTAIDPDDF